MIEIPKDPVILLSFVNMKLRDFYHSPRELCTDLGIDQQALYKKLEAIGYLYDEAGNQFR
ncbi:MAG: DUF4250 domain-containing protein [Lachnospiraceae bacterium]